MTVDLGSKLQTGLSKDSKYCPSLADRSPNFVPKVSFRPVSKRKPVGSLDENGAQASPP